MAFEIDYFHPRVLAEIESWPVDVLADYTRLAELLIEYGPSLRLPHSRAFGDGLFELRPSVACVYQKDATNAGSRTEVGAFAPEGVEKWLN